jgi:enamidase
MHPFALASRSAVLGLALVLAPPFARPGALLAQPAATRPSLSPAVRRYVAVDTAIVALRHARVIDGTGSAAREDQVLILRDGRIAEMGAEGRVAIPAGALEIDLTGKSVIPGLVMVHEHLYYPTGSGTYANLSESFTRLYLAGGVTSMRTGGNMNGYGEINTAAAINRGDLPGPWVDATAPYVTGPGIGIRQLTAVRTPDEAKRHVDFWADAGATSVKAYMHISRENLGAAIAAAHARKLRMTGHLCSVTYAEAAALGIDNLEHGFFAATDFVKDRGPDQCRQLGQAEQAAALDTSRAEMKALIATLVRRNVALTSTLTIFETFVPGRPLPPGLDVLVPSLQEDYERRHTQLATRTSGYTALYKAASAAEVAFARAGGLLVAGTDPTGGGGVIAGFSNQRALELLVEAGFSPLEAITIGTLNGARFLGRDALVGSLAIGKQADLVVIRGDPSADIAAVRRVEMVFRQGVGYDPAKLIESVRGRVGLH